MSAFTQIVQRGTKFDDGSVNNKWRWEWLSKEVELTGPSGEKINQRIGIMYVRKASFPGKAVWILCNKEMQYGKRGLVCIVDHIKTGTHTSKSFTECGNQATLPGMAQYSLNTRSAAWRWHDSSSVVLEVIEPSLLLLWLDPLQCVLFIERYTSFERHWFC